MIKKRQIIGIVMIVVSISSFFAWEKWGRDSFLYSELIVLNQNVSSNNMIDESMLDTKKTNYVPEGAYLSGQESEIIGMCANHFINEGAAIFSENLIEDKFAIKYGEDRHVMAIPNDWLASYPQTLRRGDTAYFYDTGVLITEAVVVYARDGSNQEVLSQDNDRLLSTAVVSLVEVIVSNEQANLLSQLASEGKKFVLLYN